MKDLIHDLFSGTVKDASWVRVLQENNSLDIDRYIWRCLYFSFKKLAHVTVGLPSLESAGPLTAGNSG